MHPQIRQVGSRHLPDLRHGTRAARAHGERRTIPSCAPSDSKFWIATLLAAPVVVLAMLPHLLDLHLSPGTSAALRYSELLLTTPVVLWAGADYYRRGLAAASSTARPTCTR